MSWKPITPLAATPGVVRHDAFMTLSPPASRGPRKRAALTISIRAAQFEGLDWFKPGAKVAVMLGSGENAGCLRIEPDGPFKLTAWGQFRRTKTSAGAVSLYSSQLPALLGIATSERRPPTRIEVDWGAGWLEIALPDWAKPQPARAPSLSGSTFASAMHAAPTVEAKEPFRGIASRTGIGSVAGRPNAPIPTGTGPGRNG